VYKRKICIKKYTRSKYLHAAQLLQMRFKWASLMRHRAYILAMIQSWTCWTWYVMQQKFSFSVQ
jgi:hypothetical protein